MSDLIDRAALLKELRKSRDAYFNEHFTTDPSTGASEASAAEEEYLGYLDENIEVIENFASASLTSPPKGEEGITEEERATIEIARGVATRLGNADPNIRPVAGLMKEGQRAIAALLAILSRLSRPVTVQEWQPIETAPKDGTRIYLFAKDSLKRGEGRVIGYWYKHPSVQGWLTNEIDCSDYEFDPTHWMPLPASPSPSKAEG